MKTQEPKLKKCKCGTEKSPILERVEIGCAYVVYCPSCGVTGPIANYEDEAAYNWNQRREHGDR